MRAEQAAIAVVEAECAMEALDGPVEESGAEPQVADRRAQRALMAWIALRRVSCVSASKSRLASPRNCRSSVLATLMVVSNCQAPGAGRAGVNGSPVASANGLVSRTGSQPGGASASAAWPVTSRRAQAIHRDGFEKVIAGD
jgi:hypothetical protein